MTKRSNLELMRTRRPWQTRQPTTQRVYKALATNRVDPVYVRIVDQMASKDNYTTPDLGRVEKQANAYTESPWVYVAVNKIAQAAAAAKLNVYAMGDDDPTTGVEKRVAINNHPIEQLFRHPNDLMSEFEFKKAIYASYKLTGNVYLYMANEKDGAPTSLYLMRSDRIQIVTGSNGDNWVKGYVYTVDNIKVPLDVERVIHWKNYHPTSDLYGLSEIQIAGLSVSTDIAMGTYNQSFFGKDRAVPAGVVKINTMISDDQYNKLKQEWNEAYGGGQRKVAFIRGADVNFNAITGTHADMEFLSGRNFERNLIFDVLGLPPGLIDPNATEANALAAVETLQRDTIWPLTLSFAQVLTSQLAPYYGENLIVEPQDMRKNDGKAQRDEMTAASSFLSINEVRGKYYGLPPVKWGEIPAAGSGAVAGTGGADSGKPNAMPPPKDAGKLIAEDKQDAASDAALDKGTSPAEELKAILRIVPDEMKSYNPDQPRDDHGRFGSGGGSSTALGNNSSDGAPTATFEHRTQGLTETKQDRHTFGGTIRVAGDPAKLEKQTGMKVPDLVAATGAGVIPMDKYPNAEVRLEYSEHPYTGIAQVTATIDDGEHNFFVQQSLSFMNGQPSEVHIKNMVLDKSESGSGLATKILSAQVNNAADAGFHSIQGAWFGNGKSSVDTSYKEMPRLGFDASVKLPADAGIDVPRQGNSVRVSDLMKSDAGRSWWDANGGPAEGSFSLNDGGRSRAVLNAYCQKRFGSIVKSLFDTFKARPTADDGTMGGIDFGLSQNELDLLDSIWDELSDDLPPPDDDGSDGGSDDSTKAFNADQPRDAHGRFTSGGGTGSDSSKPAPSTTDKSPESHSAKSPSAAHTMTSSELRTASNEQWKTLSESERQAAVTYSEEAYLDINYNLREGYPVDAVHEQTVANLDKAIQSGHLKGDTTIYRGISNDALAAMSTQPGAVVMDKAFLSTSASQYFADNWKDATLEIQAPAGTPCLHLDGNSANPGEDEITFGRNTQLKILSVGQERRGSVTRQVVKAQLVPSVTKSVEFFIKVRDASEPDDHGVISADRMQRFAWTSANDIVMVKHPDDAPVKSDPLTPAALKERRQFVTYASKGKDVDAFVFHHVPIGVQIALKALADVGALHLAHEHEPDAIKATDLDGNEDPYADNRAKQERVFRVATSDALAGIQTQLLRGVRHLGTGATADALTSYFSPAWWQGATDDMRAKLPGMVADNIQSAAHQTGDQAFSATGISIDPSGFGAYAVDYAQRWTDSVLKDMNQTTHDGVGAILARWIATPGAKLGELTQAIESSYLFSPNRAAQVAVTEVTRAFAQGGYAFAQNLADTLHVPLKVTEQNLKGAPPLHPNCACWLSIVPIYVKGAITAIDMQWHTNAADKVCEFCAPRNGKFLSDLKALPQ